MPSDDKNLPFDLDRLVAVCLAEVKVVIEEMMPDD